MQAEANGDLISNKTADKITKVSKTLPETVETENTDFDREISNVRYIS